MPSRTIFAARALALCALVGAAREGQAQLTLLPPARSLEADAGVAPSTAVAAPTTTQPTSASPTTAPPLTTAPPNDIKAKREEIARRLALSQRVLEAAQTGAADGVRPPERVLREVDVLKQLDVTLGQQQAAAEQQISLTASREDLTAKLTALRKSGPTEPRPYSFLLLDRMRDELETQVRRKESLAIAVTSAADNVARAKKSQADHDRARRAAKEAFSTNRKEGATADLSAEFQLQELESGVAEELVRLREMEAANLREIAAVNELRVTFLREKVEWLAGDAAFTQQELEEQLLDIGKQETELKKQIASVQNQVAYLESKWLEARERGGAEAKPDPALAEEIEARRMARQCRQQEITSLHRRLQRKGDLTTVWKRRFEVYAKSYDTAELATWEKETAQTLDDVNREIRSQNQRISDLRLDLATLDQKTRAAQETAPETAKWLTEQRTQVEEQMQVHDMNIVNMEANRRLLEKLLGEIRGDNNALPWNERLEVAGQMALTVWNYELTTVDDKPITVKKIVAGLILLGLGYFSSRFLSRWFAHRLLPRLGVHENAASALESLAFYVLVCTFALFALKLVNVPLTAFTVVGGAVAIGVGFGSQNIANNFISGLILLAERPVRVGDTIEFNGLRGVVEGIGARSTRVKTDNNLEIIVPNSALLETNVINWTLTDDRVRSRISLGVAYGSNTRRVSELLLQVAREQPTVLREPAPTVQFTNFGDNALNFDLNYWVHLRAPGPRPGLETEIRHRIDEVFREANVTMSFPQRDVHLDALKPIQISLVPAESNSLTADVAFRRAA